MNDAHTENYRKLNLPFYYYITAIPKISASESLSYLHLDGTF